MGLSDEIATRRSEIRTDSYSMSIGEWISLYESREIDIHPEFQRFYRWSETQKSNLIESIFLGIPIPPIFVSQRSDGVWDVIDGLQRLSTIYQFVGVLRNSAEELEDALVLQKTKYLPAMEGMVWDSDERPSLNQQQRLLIKRAKMDVSIVLRESQEIAKYELFQRLNTGGSHLTPQEVRNCILVMVNPRFHERLRILSEYSSFQESVALSQNNIDEQYDIELALRFLVFSNLDLESYDRSADVGTYLTDSMVALAEDESYDWDSETEKFKRTFDHIFEALGGNAFRRYSDGRNKGGFLLSPFEVIACGLGYNYPDFPSVEDVRSRSQELYNNETYKKWSGSGVRANSRLPHLLPLGREMFAR